MQHLQEQEIEAKIKSDKYKMSFDLVSGKDDQIHQNKIQIKISNVDDEKVCVEFMNLEGDSI